MSSSQEADPRTNMSPETIRCFVCGINTFKPLRLRDKECLHAACSLECLESLHSQWIDIKTDLLATEASFPSEPSCVVSDPVRAAGHVLRQKRGTCVRDHVHLQNKDIVHTQTSYCTHLFHGISTRIQNKHHVSLYFARNHENMYLERSTSGISSWSHL